MKKLMERLCGPIFHDFTVINWIGFVMVFGPIVFVALLLAWKMFTLAPEIFAWMTYASVAVGCLTWNLHRRPR